MPPLTNYNTPAASCPAIQIPAVLPNPLAPAAVPKTLPSFSGMLPSAFIPNLQQFALAVEALAERGGGIYAILSGFALTDGGGLNVRVGDGAAAIGGYVSKFTPTTGYQVAALTNSATNRVWIGQAGQVNVNTSTTPPAGAWVYAGAVVVAGGVITSFDLSGVVTLPIGGRPERRTSDVGPPADTPPVGVRFVNIGPNGWRYLWNSATYVPINQTLIETWNPGTFGASVTVYQRVAARRFTLPATLPLSKAALLTAPTGAGGVTFSLRKNGTQFGTLLIAQSATVGTFTAATDTVFVPGDILAVVAPSSADAAAAGLMLTLTGVL